ncbi:hypothetical protein [Yinghuangia seranimata]|uniref:hypothetical protein n=1 Tax=Yinghuangia seranimata TaxID=408067 RepID=UPI00248AD4BD|nr:hypothetical protein [Yinghuangia seranimata]MDI2130562.1 hypothetical protein [Yinghuangia seranimata]
MPRYAITLSVFVAVLGLTVAVLVALLAARFVAGFLGMPRRDRIKWAATAVWVPKTRPRR